MIRAFASALVSMSVAVQDRPCRDLGLAPAALCCECRRTDLDRREYCVFVDTRTLKTGRPFGFVAPSSTETLCLDSHRLGMDVTPASALRVVEAVTPALLDVLDEEQALIGALPSSPLVGFKTWTLDSYETCICCEKRILFVCVRCDAGRRLTSPQCGDLLGVRLCRVRVLLGCVPIPRRLAAPSTRRWGREHRLRDGRLNALAATLRHARGAQRSRRPCR